MKINIFKVIINFLLFSIILFFSFLMFDLAAYDSSYINKNPVTFSINNLNSKTSKKIFQTLDNFKHKVFLKFSKDYKEFYIVEEESYRENLPEIKIINKKKDNFFPGNNIDSIEKNYSNWERSHGGPSSMRFSSLDSINKNNVSNLELAWQYNSNDGKKGIQANPVVYDGLIYLPTPGNHIVCLDGSSGKEVWRYKVEKGYHAAKRGIQIWKDEEKNIIRLFFTNDDQLISLNAKTGLPIKNFGKNGIIKIGSSPIPPAIIDNQLVLATSRPAIEVYDLISGKLKWKYYLREIDKKNLKEKNFSDGKPWGGMSYDIDKGLVFLATGNPKPMYVGIERPGRNLFANSIIAFDIRNKKKLWHFQETCHDIWNYDIPSTPILSTINKYNKRIDVVISVTKLGNTIILDRYSGEPIFDYHKKKAPASKLPGEKTCLYQPSLKLPEPFARNVFSEDDITNLNKSSTEYITSIVENSNYGFFQPYELNKYTIQYNNNGGAQWSGASVDPYDNVMYVTASNIAYQVGLKLYKKDGKFRYVDNQSIPLRDKEGYPGTKPPWGTLSALNLNSGKLIWQVPLGYYETLKSKGIITGTENFGGATATAGGLVFASGTLDKLLRAFDSSNGKELWSYKLPFIGSAPPTSYEVKGEQFIVLPASGGISLKIFYGDKVELGDSVLAFKLKK